MSDLVFECPNCGQNLLEEVLTDAVVTSVIYVDAETGDASYGNADTDLGSVSHYQCSLCGWQLPDIDSLDDLTEWLLEQPDNAPYRKNFEMEENDE